MRLSTGLYANYLTKLRLFVHAGPDGLHEGDWICPKCDNVNFAFRTTCNIKKCGAPRPSSVSDFMGIHFFFFLMVTIALDDIVQKIVLCGS